MKDEGFVDDSFIEKTAWERRADGDKCASVLRSLPTSPSAGNDVSAQTWRAIAELPSAIVRRVRAQHRAKI